MVQKMLIVVNKFVKFHSIWIIKLGLANHAKKAVDFVVDLKIASSVLKAFNYLLILIPNSVKILLPANMKSYHVH